MFFRKPTKGKTPPKACYFLLNACQGEIGRTGKEKGVDEIKDCS
jgi:hypothetical protein